MKKFDDLEKEISDVKKEVTQVGHMHPGTLSLQTRSHGGQYNQLSYSFKGKGHTLYVREADVEQVREEVANYRKFRSLVDRWIELEIEYSKERRSSS